MARKYSRRTALTLTGVGVLSACDVVAFPGTGQAAGGTAKMPTTPPPNPTPSSLPSTNNTFTYEIVRTDQEWRDRLTPAEYNILREGGTERRNSHRYTQLDEAGSYHCQGCDLPVYDNAEKVILNIGYVFFRHALKDSVLFGREDDGRIEAHCRRCGSHLGHVLYVENEILHCINGTALGFKAA